MQTPSHSVQMTPRPVLRYGTEQLNEFRAIIQQKLADSRLSADQLESALLLDRSNGTDDTYRHLDILEGGQESLEREEAARHLERQRQFQQQLQNALARIEQGTYGVCRATGILIPVERLRAVPHATLSMEAKEAIQK